MSDKGTKTIDGDQSPIDISSILGRPVANAVSQPVFSPETPQAEVVMDPEVEADPQRPAFQFQPDADYEQQYEQEPQSLSPDDLAIIGVNLLDGLQSTVFALIRRNKVFDEAELEMIGKLDHSAKTVYPEGSREAIAMAKFNRHKAAVAKLPFSDGEKSRLTDATKIYARTTQIKVSPFMGILLAYSEVLGTRAFTVLGDTE